MQTNQRKHQRLQILHQIVKHPKAFRVLAFVDVDQGADFCGLQPRNRVSSRLCFEKKDLLYLKGDVLAPKPDLEFLSAVFVFLGPFGVVFPTYYRYVSEICLSREGLRAGMYFIISLSLMMRLISWIIRPLTHT